MHSLELVAAQLDRVASLAAEELPACVASVAAHRKFAQLAKARGVRLIVLGTWGPDSIWQTRLSRGLRNLAKAIDAGQQDGELVTRIATDVLAGPQVSLHHVDDAPSAPVALVLGAGLNPDATPSAFLAGRLEVARRVRTGTFSVNTYAADLNSGASKAAEAWVNGYLDSFTQWEYAKKAFDKWSADFARRFATLRNG